MSLQEHIRQPQETGATPVDGAHIRVRRTGVRLTNRLPERGHVPLRCIAAAAAGVLLLVGSSGLAQSGRKPDDEAPAVTLTSYLVTLSVTVSSHGGHPAQGLQVQDFAVYDNDVKQTISFFSSDAVPVSWGLVLDRSASMADMMRDVYRAATHVIDEGTAEDEVFVATFEERVSLATGFISDRHKLGNSLLDLEPGGTTALWDAVGFGLDHIQGARHRKKVLVVVTDGEDNASRTTLRQVYERAEAGDVLIYPVGMFEESAYSRFGLGSKDAASENARFGLEMLAKATGTAAHFPSTVDECKRAMTAIGKDVRQQYTLAFYPTDVVRDGRWHAVRVAVRPGDSAAKYVVRTRSGYYATNK